MSRNQPPSLRMALLACGLLIALVATLAQPFSADAAEIRRDTTAESIRNPVVPSAEESLMTADGRTRTYRIYLPASYDGAEAVPLVLVFHGAGGSGAQVERQTRFDALAEQEGFIVVYPDGSASARELVPTWNAGHCCGYALNRGIDDVAFVDQLLDQLEADYAIDGDRIYATGFSNGSMLTYRLACDLPERFAAVAPVSGTTPSAGCAPSQPIPLLAIHGTGDEIVPYNGGPVQGGARDAVYPAVPELIAEWAALDGCDPTPDASTEADATITAYTRCAAGVSVLLYTIEDGAHAWPGGIAPVERPGYHSDLDATGLIWSFFAAHER